MLQTVATGPHFWLDTSSTMVQIRNTKTKEEDKGFWMCGKLVRYPLLGLLFLFRLFAVYLNGSCDLYIL